MTTSIDTSFQSPAPQPFPAPPATARPRRGGTAAIVVGAVLATSGFLTAASGGALLGSFGDGHAVGSGEHTISTPTSAIITDLGHINNIRGFEALTGSPTLHISAQNIDESGIFVGVGRTQDVEAYLNGVPTDRVKDFDLAPFRMDTVREPGAGTTDAPVVQSFWVASAESSTRADLSWAVQEGSYEVVVMNADGSAGVLTSASVGASLPTSTGLWIMMVGIGVLLIIGGGGLIVIGARSARPSRR